MIRQITAILSLLILANPLTAGEITIKGSDTMILLGQKWAENYMKAHPETSIQVTGGGSGTGIAALRNNATDIAQASREMKSKEKAEILIKHGEAPIEVRTALDGVTVYAHQDNPVRELSFEQLSAIFRGKITNWQEVGGPNMAIVVYSRENNSGTYAFFKEAVLDDADFSARALTMVGTSALINAISKDKGGIGYGGIGYSSGVKIVAVKKANTDVATLPTTENVVSGAYPLSRYLNFYLLPKANKGEVKNFIDWVLSEGGQSVVEEVGYFPMPKPGAIAPKPVASAPISRPVVSTPAPASAISTYTRPPATVTTPAVASAAPAVSTAEFRALQEQMAELASMLEKRPAMTSASVSDASELADREQALGERELLLAKREAELTERMSSLTERERQVMSRESMADSKMNSVALREQQVTTRENIVARAEVALEQDKASLQAYEESLMEKYPEEKKKGGWSLFRRGNR